MKSGKPWDRLSAPVCTASWDMVVKMVVPTFGSLLRIMEPSFLGCIRHGVESEHSGSSGQEKG
ncbi:hypothetical protein D3C84_1208690 [compost metagenome]